MSTTSPLCDGRATSKMQATSIFSRVVFDGCVCHLIQSLISPVLVNQVCWVLLITILTNKINANHPSSYSFNYFFVCELLKAVANLALKSKWATDPLQIFVVMFLKRTHDIEKNTVVSFQKPNPDFGNLVWMFRRSWRGYILKHAISWQVSQYAFIW